jgi:hypothetical protein
MTAHEVGPILPETAQAFPLDGASGYIITFDPRLIDPLMIDELYRQMQLFPVPVALVATTSPGALRIFRLSKEAL